MFEESKKSEALVKNNSILKPDEFNNHFDKAVSSVGFAGSAGTMDAGYLLDGSGRMDQECLVGDPVAPELRPWSAPDLEMILGISK
ncbi:hypothetical protein NPIL_375301 [Nephila pilipes]|uniref:Uncharacterized protein n=1 Tax=Nephila pilipes TaxID=299642 RepID=A0A8X6T4X3_NEPPI|nr:hypothetical protein NPIL_375301 [Nephila pilipes]